MLIESNMNRSRSRQSRAALALGLIALTALFALACSKPCEHGESRCGGGKKLERCFYPCETCDLDWQPTECPAACIAETDGGAFCSLSETPDPQCSDRAGYCAADLQIYCHAGYPVHHNRCEAPIQPGTAQCVDVGAAGLGCFSTGPVPPHDDGGVRDSEADAAGDRQPQ